MIKEAVKNVFKFLFKPILNRYYFILEKLSNQQESLDLIYKKIEELITPPINPITAISNKSIFRLL